MRRRVYIIKSKVWLYQGMAGWHFVSVPKRLSEEIKVGFGARARGWGSLPITVTIGSTSWKTSIFPDKQSGGIPPSSQSCCSKEGENSR